VLTDVESSFEEAYRAATEGALALDRSHLATVAARGKDRESFLQNMLTNDVRSLAPGAGVPAAFLTNKGKLVSDLLVFKADDAFLLQLERERAEPFRKALDRYIISEDVALESRAETEAMFSLEGPKASGILRSSLASPCPIWTSSPTCIFDPSIFGAYRRCPRGSPPRGASSRHGST
jgi:folate-binding Fe-S cluster repair protein YgfZ